MLCVPIAMKLELDVWRHLLEVYTKFEIDISKYVEKVKKSPKNPKHAKIIAQIQKIRFLRKTELMLRNVRT